MSTSRSLMAALLVATALIAFVFWPRGSDDTEGMRAGTPQNQPLERKRRSVVLITTDTTRADHLEPYGSAVVKTPVLQSLADQGMLMERAYAVAPLTLPAHTSILTGLYPLQTGVRNNGTHMVPTELSTLAERFSADGFRTGAFVSASVLERRYGLDQGFEVYDDDLSKSRIRLPRMVPDRPAEFTVAAASEWLDTIGEDEDFFIWVHFYDPHAVTNPPAKFRDEHKTHLYAGEIAYMDEQIGELLAHPRIQASPELVVSVIGDHGESLGEHGENTHGILAYRSTLHVPWILWVKNAERKVRVKIPVSQVDLAPTLLDLGGMLEADHSMAGQSLLAPINPERLLYSESYLPFYSYGWSPLHVIRRGQWEYIDAPEAELFDLKRDPRELSNQSTRRSDVAEDLKSTLDAFREEHGVAEGAENKLEMDQESLEKLRALGYVSMETVPTEIEGPRADPKEMIQLHTKHERARSFMNEHLYVEAAKLLRELLEGDPRNLAAMADLSDALHKMGELDEAASVVENALQQEPNHQQLLLTLAHIEAQRGAEERAIKLAEQVLEQNRSNLGAWALKARLHSKLGQKQAAEATLTEALVVDPLSPLINTLYAQMVEMPAKKYAEAEERLRQATARDPFSTGPWRVLGGLLENQARLDEAEAAYRQGLEHTPDEPSLHALYAVLLARRGHPDAEAHLREAIRRETEFRSELYVSLGAQLAEKGRLDEANEMYDKVLAVNPRHPAARNNRAIALARSGQMEAARDELVVLVKENPKYADAHNNLAVIFLNAGDFVGAEEHARTTVGLSPNMAEAWDTLGAALRAQGRMPEAVTALDKSLALAPDYWSARLNRAQIRLVVGDTEGARADFEAALAVNGALPDAYFELGQLHEGSFAQPGRARSYYRAFIEKFPSDPRANEVRDRLMTLASAP